MNATDLTFNIKDVIAIVVAVGGGVAFVLAIRSSNRTTDDKLQAVVQELEKHKMDTKEKIVQIQAEANLTEDRLETRLDKLNEEQKRIHEEISRKMDGLGNTVNSINNSLSELTGYLKGKGDIP